MLGLGSVEMAWAYWLCLAAAAICVVYGLVNWNRSAPDLIDVDEAIDYRKKERAIGETMP